MNKTINVNESSIIDLKAELYRKEEQFQQEKTSNVGKDKEKQQVKGSKTLEKLATLTGKKQTGIKRKTDSATSSSNAKILSSEEVAEFEKSKLKLQAKARLYDKMSTGEVEDPDDDDESTYLVDFHKKVYGSKVKDSDNSNVNNGDEWVEFEDSLGRQRRCMIKDLEHFKALDVEFRPKERTPSPPALSSEDARREMMKKKWEAEQEELSRNLERDIHYQNVLFDEARGHGVAYYQFSKDETERKSQMETLNQLRAQTMEQRAKREQIKAKRQAALDARLAKIKQKKLQTQQIEADEPENRSVVNDLSDDKRGEKNTDANSKSLEESEKQGGSLTSRNAANNGVQSSITSATDPGNSFIDPQVSNWGQAHQKDTTVSDKRTEGSVMKRKDFKSSYSQWIQASREERIEEFAPPSFYYDSVPHNPKYARTNQSQ